MAKSALALNEDKSPQDRDLSAILNALASVVVVIDQDGHIIYANNAAELFFCASAVLLRNTDISGLLSSDNPMFALIDQVRRTGNAMIEYGVHLESPRIGKHFVNVQAIPITESPGCIVISIQERSIAEKIDRQLTHRGAARSVSAMAAMLAHEVKNPLSGIRGAAQLLEENVSADDRTLTTLIREETDRICALVDRMEIFSDTTPLKREAVNIHQVLDRVRQVAENGFGRHIEFVQIYDPSLPLVLGNRDQLIQVFLNLVKNASEAAPKKGGEIVLSTAYRHGVSFAVPGSDSRVHLPLMVCVQDNGEGIPEDIQNNLFDPFVTSKHNGKGLGLALVAKIIGQHGGVIEYDSNSIGAAFRLMLPMASETETG